MNNSNLISAAHRFRMFVISCSPIYEHSGKCVRSIVVKVSEIAGPEPTDETCPDPVVSIVHQRWSLPAETSAGSILSYPFPSLPCTFGKRNLSSFATLDEDGSIWPLHISIIHNLRLKHTVTAKRELQKIGLAWPLQRKGEEFKIVSTVGFLVRAVTIV